ncbi:helix-turn-helix domain-containing protein [Aquisalibacillus elongatus]
MIGSTRETTSATISQLKKEGVIMKEAGNFSINTYLANNFLNLL